MRIFRTLALAGALVVSALTLAAQSVTLTESPANPVAGQTITFTCHGPTSDTSASVFFNYGTPSSVPYINAALTSGAATITTNLYAPGAQSAFCVTYPSNSSATGIDFAVAPAPGYDYVRLDNSEVNGGYIRDASGKLLANGTITFQPVDALGHPASYTIKGVQNTLAVPVSRTISNGGLGTVLMLGRSDESEPVGISYQVSVTDASTGAKQTLGTVAIADNTSATGVFDLSEWVPPVTTAPPATYIVGPVGPQGPQGPAGTATAAGPAGSIQVAEANGQLGVATVAELEALLGLTTPGCLQTSSAGAISSTGTPCGTGDGGDGTGTLTGITAGSGLTGGGTSGAVTLGLAQSVTLSTVTAPSGGNLDVNSPIVVGGGLLPGILTPTISVSGASTLGGATTLTPLGTGSSSANYGSPSLNLGVSYWNGSASVTDGWTASANIGTGAAPYSALDFYAPSSLTTNLDVLFGLNPNLAATSSANYNSPALLLRGAYYTGTQSLPDTWYMQSVLGTGANPYSALTFTHSGTSGAAVFAIPGLQLASVTTAGCAQFASNGVLSSTGQLCATAPVQSGYSTSARQPGTAYQNTSSQLLFVAVTCTINGSVSASTGPTSSVGNLVSSWSGSGNTVTLSFSVLPGQWYEVTSTGTYTPSQWWETTL